MTYVRAPLETNPTTLAQEVFDYITLNAPNWSPNEGNLDVWIIRAISQLASENRDIASDVQDDIYRYFGATIMGILPNQAVSAIGNTTWTLINSAGHTIPDGTTVGVRNTDNELLAFKTIGDVVVPAGSTTTGVGEVVIKAITPGTASSGLGTAVELIDVIDWVQSVVLVAVTSGGLDEEDDPTYLNRLVKQIRRLNLRPILPADFAALAVDADPTVQRAVAIDGYNPAGATYNNLRMVSIAAVTAAGTAVSAGAKTAIDAYLQANREVNFVVNVIDPNFTTINVADTVVKLPGYVASSVKASVEAAVAAYLSPAKWGQDPQVQDDGQAATWIETPTLYYNEVIALISNVPGVDRVTALTLNGGTANITLTTPAALTQVGTNVTTVT